MSHDAVIIGGGLAGSTLAAALARAGRDVVLLEKTATAHDKVCGDFLSQEALHYLSRSGIDHAALGGVPLSEVRLVGREVLAEAALPFKAVSLRRRVLDEALLTHAITAGGSIRRGVRAQSISCQAQSVAVQMESEAPIEATSLFLATGKYDLKGQPRRVGWQNDLIAFKMYFRLLPTQQQKIARHIELILFPGGYAGLQPVDDGLANLCLLVTRKQFKLCGSKWTQLLETICHHSSHLATRLAGSVPTLERPLALSAIPYGYLAAKSVPQIWRVGDQSAVIPSFSGDGMSIALHSAHLAAAMYLEGESSTTFAARLRHQLGPGVTLATVISQLLVRLPQAVSILRLNPTLVSRIASATRIPTRCLLP
jgi:flavin-dependent dehydrogenase